MSFTLEDVVADGRNGFNINAGIEYICEGSQS